MLPCRQFQEGGSLGIFLSQPLIVGSAWSCSPKGTSELNLTGVPQKKLKRPCSKYFSKVVKRLGQFSALQLQLEAQGFFHVKICPFNHFSPFGLLVSAEYLVPRETCMQSVMFIFVNGFKRMTEELQMDQSKDGKRPQRRKHFSNKTGEH